MNAIEHATRDMSATISILIGRAAALPASRLKRLLRFLNRYTELLRQKQAGLFDDDDQEELELVADGIGEMLSHQRPKFVEHLVSPSSAEAEKADKWFADVGRRIRQLRKTKGLRQSDLAEKTQLSQGAISRIENGYLAASHSTVEKIAKALEVPPSQIDPGLT